jgi:putative transposase
MKSRIEYNRLRRLSEVWIEKPIWFITTCTEKRAKVLTNSSVPEILVSEWKSAEKRHGWRIGFYVIMPDHVHFFCSAMSESKDVSVMMNRWKEWTSKRIMRELGLKNPIWQEGFFDHLLRSDESYQQKWEYFRDNPVRANLIGKIEDWKFWGEINVL